MIVVFRSSRFLPVQHESVTRENYECKGWTYLVFVICESPDKAPVRALSVEPQKFSPLVSF